MSLVREGRLAGAVCHEKIGTYGTWKETKALQGYASDAVLPFCHCLLYSRKVTRKQEELELSHQ